MTWLFPAKHPLLLDPPWPSPLKANTGLGFFFSGNPFKCWNSRLNLIYEYWVPWATKTLHVERFLMVNKLVFRWTKLLFFMVLGAHGNYNCLFGFGFGGPNTKFEIGRVDLFAAEKKNSLNKRTAKRTVQCVLSRELKYPTKGKENSSSQLPMNGIC